MEVIDNRKESVFDKIKAHPVVRKIKKIKNVQLIAAVFIIAIALIIYSGVSAGKNQPAEQVSDTAMDSEEIRLGAMLGGIEGAGKVETMITRRDNTIVGVLIIAEGANDIGVMLKLLDAATTALGVDQSIVDVYAMK